MEVARIGIGLGFFGLAAWSFFSFTQPPETITFRDVELQPMGTGFAVVGQIDNPGPPDRLVGITSDAAGQAMVMGGDNIALPSGGTPSLAMDGAHGMLMNIQGDVTEGRLIPVSLWFEEAGRISARARITSGMEMDHSQAFDVPASEPQPSLALMTDQDQDGVTIVLTTTAFTFSKDAVDGPHQAGIGHAHLYLNGLKLQRMYTPEARIGALPSGTYLISVSLNTNDHRAYSVDGRLVTATQTITVD